MPDLFNEIILTRIDNGTELEHMVIYFTRQGLADKYGSESRGGCD